ncbi:MAG TPA: hypothetical protein VFT28_08355, partial [Gemmatimonadales bacterium]|nr:hypothetical protein [Gemmatimonadales bacterium]
TPSRLSRLCRDNGLEVVRLTPYYNSDYTSFFVPIYTVEMLRQVTMCGLGLRDFCEGFTIVARAPADGRAGAAEAGDEAGALANRSGS